MSYNWVYDSGWVKLRAHVEEGGIVAVSGAVSKGESGFGKPEDLDSERLVDKGDVGEDKRKRAKRKDNVKLFEWMAVAQGRGDPKYWASISIS